MKKCVLNPSLAQILRPAYDPCSSFAGTCLDMRWIPEAGHVPRGFRGAAGSLEEIELVLVYAEPGDPLPGEKHTGLESAYAFSVSTFESGATQFHQNVKYIIEACWPGMPYSDQMKRVWMTESVLCSAPKESGGVRASVCHECGTRYLLPQLRLMPRALVVALGSKARERLRRLGVKDFLEAGAVSPPGCNLPTARASWDRVVAEVKRRRA